MSNKLGGKILKIIEAIDQENLSRRNLVVNCFLFKNIILMVNLKSNIYLNYYFIKNGIVMNLL
jgi:hypothetical protein